MELVMLDNKKFAYKCLEILRDKECFSQVVLNILMNEEECKRLFKCSKFPILSEVSFVGELTTEDCYDDKCRQRYYKDKFIVNRRAFVVTNHWYGPNKSMPDNRTPFEAWVKNKINK